MVEQETNIDLTGELDKSIEVNSNASLEHRSIQNKETMNKSCQTIPIAIPPSNAMSGQELMFSLCEDMVVNFKEEVAFLRKRLAEKENYSLNEIKFLSDNFNRSSEKLISHDEKNSLLRSHKVNL